MKLNNRAKKQLLLTSAVAIASLLSACGPKVPKLPDSFTTEVLAKDTNPALEVLRSASVPKVTSEADAKFRKETTLRYGPGVLPPLADQVWTMSDDPEALAKAFEALPSWRTVQVEAQLCSEDGRAVLSRVIVKGNDPIEQMPWDRSFASENSASHLRESGAALWTSAVTGIPAVALYFAGKPNTNTPTSDIRVGSSSAKPATGIATRITCKVPSMTVEPAPDVAGLSTDLSAPAGYHGYRYVDSKAHHWTLTLSENSKDWQLSHDFDLGQGTQAKELFEEILTEHLAANQDLLRLTRTSVVETGTPDRYLWVASFSFLGASTERLFLGESKRGYEVMVKVSPGN